MSYKWSSSVRYVDTDLNRPRWRSTIHYRVLARLQLGLEFNPSESEFSPLMNAFLLTETEKRPAMVLGTSSDRIGSPEGKQAYYITVAKHHPNWPFSGYFSVNYSEWDKGFNVPFGVAWEFNRNWAAQTMFDGDEYHLLLNWRGNRYAASLLWVWMESPGIAFSMEF